MEIDECKIGLRKYKRGRVVEGSWVLGMIVCGKLENFRIEICPNIKRDQETLIELVKKHIELGTEIHKDMWKGYLNFKDHGYEHLSVNDSKNFVNPDTGAYTQNIESS